MARQSIKEARNSCFQFSNLLRFRLPYSFFLPLYPKLLVLKITQNSYPLLNSINEPGVSTILPP